DGTDSDTSTATVTVTEPSASPVVTAAVYPILVDGRQAQVSIGVFDGDGVFVGEATVEGVWAYLDRHGREKTADVSGVTSSQPVDGFLGNLVLSQRFPPNSTVVSFCVTAVSAPGYEYQPSTSCSEPLQ
ncbi:MAG TPA: hypothetical protein VE569_02300, partial [Acidimicrobiia bacterium]|nr:hypothetical protein [Acidimicrobiia bacterium]